MFGSFLFLQGLVAQLARAPRLQRGGREFEPPQVHHEVYRNGNIKSFCVSRLCMKRKIFII